MTPHEFIALYRFPVISKYYFGSVMTIYKEVISASVCIHFLFLCLLETVLKIQNQGMRNGRMSKRILCPP